MFTSGIAKGFLKKVIKEILSEYSTSPKVDIDRSERKISIVCRLIGEEHNTTINIRYRIWKEKDTEGHNKRYLVKVEDIKISDKKWLEIIANSKLRAYNFIWYRKGKYWDRVHTKHDRMRWITKINGKKTTAKHIGTDFYIPNHLFLGSTERKGLDKALYT